ncbi:hypothetical protein ACFL43_00360 [Thermodesulfobacteriota bacterium]
MKSEEEIVIEKSIEIAKEFANHILESPLKQLGGILSDTIGFWRLKNQVNILVKAQKYVNDRGIEPTKVLPDIFVPIIEEGGSVEDPDLQDMFAKLLASHLDDKQDRLPLRSFAKTLALLSPSHSVVLRMAYALNTQFDRMSERAAASYDRIPLTPEMIEAKLDSPSDWLIPDHLCSIGIFEEKDPKGGRISIKSAVFEEVNKALTDGIMGMHQSTEKKTFELTGYGGFFCDACIGKSEEIYKLCEQLVSDDRFTHIDI